MEQGPKTINDFMVALNVMMQKWTAEGNIDSERDIVEQTRQQVSNGDIDPAEGIAILSRMDSERIER